MIPTFSPSCLASTANPNNTPPRSIEKVLSFLKREPLLMNVIAGRKAINQSRSYWFCFMKIPKANGGTN